MQNSKDNICLIGMPGSGKSTVGVLLAKALGYAFLDTDLIIQEREGRQLQAIVDTQGALTLREIEANVCLSLNPSKSIISTGGSAVYSNEAMKHLGSLGKLIWLDVSLPVMENRILNPFSRGLAKMPDDSLADLYHERFPLYEKFADLRCRADDVPAGEVANRILGLINNN